MSNWKGTLEQVVQTRRGSLVGYAYLFTGDRAAAEDLVHDAIIRTFTRARDLGNIHAAEGYVKRVIATQFINSTRSAKVLRDKSHLIATPEGTPGHAGAVADSVSVEAAIMTLTPRERACIVLRFYEDQTVPEMARSLGIAEGTIKRYLHTAIGRLHEVLGDTPGLRLTPDDNRVAVTPRSK
ncbi:MAG: RNA polymerase subunit sigma-24 [Actinobacteria bacterium HGW-Actinobacteria-4]|nr:MAG: RNA polymerase subunit sigma-24 [Actinobacteria bacterium HGW-Actinobacteria-4]